MSEASARQQFRRLLLSWLVVAAVSLLFLIQGTTRDAMLGTWFSVGFILTEAFPHQSFDFSRWPVLHALCTTGILVITARNRTASLIATIWFVSNVLNGLYFLTIYDGHS
jgi:hypothetical protein